MEPTAVLGRVEIWAEDWLEGGQATVTDAARLHVPWSPGAARPCREPHCQGAGPTGIRAFIRPSAPSRQCHGHTRVRAGRKRGDWDPGTAGPQHCPLSAQLFCVFTPGTTHSSPELGREMDLS